MFYNVKDAVFWIKESETLPDDWNGKRNPFRLRASRYSLSMIEKLDQCSDPSIKHLKIFLDLELEERTKTMTYN